MQPTNIDPGADRWMRRGIASLWLATGLLVVHPEYRRIGSEYLGRLGVPDHLMYAACAGEFVLGLAILRFPMGRALAFLQVGAVLFFTAILAGLEPMLLAHPFGVLSKNIPFVALVLTTWLTQREGWTPRALWVLRAGVAAIWITEGIVPKILFQGEYEREVVSRSGLVPIDPGTFLYVLGAAQALSGIAVLVLRGRWLRLLLGAQFLALVALPILVSFKEPLLWFHPFGPMTKNLPILAGTYVLVRRLGCSSS